MKNEHPEMKSEWPRILNLGLAYKRRKPTICLFWSGWCWAEKAISSTKRPWLFVEDHRTQRINGPAYSWAKTELTFQTWNALGNRLSLPRRSQKWEAHRSLPASVTGFLLRRFDLVGTILGNFHPAQQLGRGEWVGRKARIADRGKNERSEEVKMTRRHAELGNATCQNICGWMRS